MSIERMLTEEEPVAELVGRVLQEAGIEYVFGISGGHTGRIVAGLRKIQNSLRMVMVREESLAGVMAEVYGRLTRRPGVLIGQGPWVLGNGMIGTIEAFLSSLAHGAADRLLRCVPAATARAVPAGDRRLWQLGRAAGVLRRDQAGDAGDRSRQRGAGDATRDQACDFRPAGTGRGAVQPGFAGRHDRSRTPCRRCIPRATICRRCRRRPIPPASPLRSMRCWRRGSRW